MPLEKRVRGAMAVRGRLNNKKKSPQKTRKDTEIFHIVQCKKYKRCPEGSSTKVLMVLFPTAAVNFAALISRFPATVHLRCKQFLVYDSKPGPPL